MDVSESDASLVEECLGGRPEAFETLVKRYQDGVYNMNLSLTRYNRVEAADLTQEAFIRAYQKLHLYKRQYAFKNWLFGLASNVSKNRFRGNTRRRQAEQEYADDQVHRGDFRDDARRVALIEAMRQLPEQFRVAVSLRHTEGLSYDEISHVLGIGVSAAKMRVSRGTDMLSRLVALRGKEDGNHEE